jgi:hypothetical protein
MADEKKGLQREEEPARPARDRRPRDRDDRRPLSRDEEPGGERGEAAHERGDRSARRRDSRPALGDEVKDLNRAAALALTEGVALTFDVFARVLQGAVDRALDEDYAEPGDVLRGLSREADLVGYDLVDELRRVPRQIDRRFEEGLRSPRAARGERWRRR